MSSKSILVTPVYDTRNIMKVVTQVKVDKIILLADGEGENDKVDNSIEDIKERLDEVVEIDLIRADPYNMAEIAEKVNEAIDKEEGNDITINVTPGRKTQAFALAFSGFAKQDKIKEIVYFKEEGGKLRIPMLEVSMAENKKLVLEMISEGINDVDELEANLDISKGMVYNHVRDLKEKGYIEETEEGLKTTESGQLVSTLTR
jgi:CRISPR-associated protein Csa3